MITKKFEDFKKIYENKINSVIELNTLLLSFLSVDSYSSGPVHELGEHFDNMATEDIDEFYRNGEMHYLFGEELDLFVSPKKVAKEFMEQMNLKSDEIIDCIGLDTIESIHMSDFESPRQYNYTTDSALVNLKVKEGFIDELITKIEDDENFLEFLEDNYKSRSGFMSFTEHELEPFIEKLRERNEQEIGAALSYITDEECVKDIVEEVIESIRGNSSYSDYLSEENATELARRDELLSKLKVKAQEVYGKENSVEQLIEYAMANDNTTLDFDKGDWEKVAEIVFKNATSEIESKSGKLNL